MQFRCTADTISFKNTSLFYTVLTSLLQTCVRPCNQEYCKEIVMCCGC